MLFYCCLTEFDTETEAQAGSKRQWATDKACRSVASFRPEASVRVIRVVFTSVLTSRPFMERATFVGIAPARWSKKTKGLTSEMIQHKRAGTVKMWFFVKLFFFSQRSRNIFYEDLMKLRGKYVAQTQSVFFRLVCRCKLVTFCLTLFIYQIMIMWLEFNHGIVANYQKNFKCSNLSRDSFIVWLHIHLWKNCKCKNIDIVNFNQLSRIGSWEASLWSSLS